MPSVTDIRRQFIAFFEGHGHTHLPSSSLVPANDPTLMFANAGMNQFKNIFTCAEKPITPRAATAQKCVRAGGKHNDLDNVGYTARHHTFFEMLGNFSFGDYFKEQAISHAWELLTSPNWWGIPKDKLYVTVYHTDDEAYKIWSRIIGLSDDRIIRIATNDNFWSMGDTGPCGPCSEIFYDHGAHIAGGLPGTPGEDGDRFIEIWNLVFMQYNQLLPSSPPATGGHEIAPPRAGGWGGNRVPLPKPSIDTGMGLERISAVLQGVHDNYDIDLFKTLIHASEEFSKNHDPKHNVSHRVIADHLRSSSFLIADGVLPGNEGRGYVLRRIMRRAMRHAHILGCRDPLMHKLVPTLVSEMGAAYPELQRAQAVIVETLKLEEEKFKETLDRGLKLLDEEKTKLLSSPPEGERGFHLESRGGITPSTLPPTKTANAVLAPPQGGSRQFPGTVAFKLYDTYGFPLDLTQDILRAENMTVDLDGFNAAMAEQKARARAAWKGSGQSATASLWFDVKERVGASEFLGYALEEAQAEITALVRDGKEVRALNAGETGQLLTNQTPFYAESGGQIGDTGSIKSGTASARVTDTTKPLDGMIAHSITVESGTLRVGDVVTLAIDAARRNSIRANHSATHLLHAALRETLGVHVTQKGSLVSADRLRFDIAHPKAIARAELDAVEAQVNHYIAQASPATTKLMSQKEAIAAGAMALFGEKYGDEVRVLAMGKTADGHDFSVELCGGTHVSNTGDIGLFKIIGEGSVSSGVRRIEAVTNHHVAPYLQAELDAQNQQIARLEDDQAKLLQSLNRTPAASKNAAVELHNISNEKMLAAFDREFKLRQNIIEQLQDENKKLGKEAAEAKKQAALAGGGEATIETIGAYKLASRIFGELDAKSLRDLATSMQQKHADAVSVLLAASEGKASIIVAIGKELAGKVDAPTLVRAAVETVGGKGGGGRPDFAQGGGPDGDKLEAALAAIKAALAA